MEQYITITGAKEHNLKNISLKIPKNKLVVITGLSGSGKSTLAFDTIYAEGQRRYVESLSAYARQFLQMQNKPDVDSIDGLSPAIAIDQKTTSKNPRSTVGTVTEIYDYLRLLYARIGIPYSPVTGKPIESQSVTQMVDLVLELPLGSRFYLLAPIVRGMKGEHRRELLALRKQGFQRVKIDGEVYELDDLPTLDKNIKHDMKVIVDRIVIDSESRDRIVESIETAVRISEGLLEIEMLEDIEGNSKKYSKGQSLLFSEKFACPVSGFQISEIEPRIFSFNSPFGACPSCEGLGKESFFDINLIVEDPKLSIKEGVIKPWETFKIKYQNQILDSLAKHFKFSLEEPFGSLPQNIQDMILFGTDEQIEFTITEGYRSQTVSKNFEGIVGYLEKKWRETESAGYREELMKFKSKRHCTACGGYRLKPESLCIRVGDLNIGQLCDLTITKCLDWFNKIEGQLSSTHQKIAARVIKEITERLGFLNNVGLEYLTLSRESGTLSGGEGQRIRLASQIGSGLCGVLYVLDEPSIGLHQRDNSRLIETLKKLRDLGNTVIVVEHDEETMLAADYLIDIGPGAGMNGGNVIAMGTPQEVINNPDSITGQYLSGKKYIPIPKATRTGHPGKSLKLIGASSNNLQNVSITIPLGKMVCITGVSGSGKSTLIIHTLYKAAIQKIEQKKIIPGTYQNITGLEYIDKVIDINQSPIGRTPRSNPATYTGAFNHIRDWFVGLSESKARGYKPGRFSFNVKGGRCETCQGDGMIKIEMHFLPDVYVECEECQGKRYNRATLEVKYKNKSIADILDMSVETALSFFDNVPQIKDKLQSLFDVGLGYIKLGQSATTLSGGEAQRVKLAKELARKSTGRTLYILDEPTTGLHCDDIKRLLKVLHTLVDKGNTAVIIEHNLDVVKTSDYCIDIGPEGGDKGGEVVFEGTPANLVKCKRSITGHFLKKIYENSKTE
jgi:excinuclease ABC subunit A